VSLIWSQFAGDTIESKCVSLSNPAEEAKTFLIWGYFPMLSKICEDISTMKTHNCLRILKNNSGCQSTFISQMNLHIHIAHRSQKSNQEFLALEQSKFCDALSLF